MRKTMIAFLLFCLCTAVYRLPVQANHVQKMEIDVALCQDGSAVITQEWSAKADEGTEFYLACRDSGYLTITDFSVSDESGTYTLSKDWDVNASFQEKAGRCGILETEDGVELCWGIGEYGAHQYTVTYVIHDLVGAYDDVDGFNHRFVDEMNVFPTDVILTIRSQDGTPLTDEECDIWAFGYDGQIRFEDGVIRAWSESELESGGHMTVMVSLKKGILMPLRQMSESFETVKERAFEGSDYEEEGGFSDFLLGVFLFAAVGGIVALIAVIAAKIRKVKLRKRMGRIDYFRDAPNDGNLNVTYRLGSACGLCREDSLLGAYLLRLISDGALEPEETDARSPQVDLRLIRPPVSGIPCDDAFYAILEAAAGEDGILQAKELEQFCDRDSKPLVSFVESCGQDADLTMIRGGCYKGAVCQGVKSLTPKGQRQLDEILGLKRFLLDFSLIHERGVKETVIWQDYLIYAHLLGIADRVIPQIRKLYPDSLPQVERFWRCIGYAGYYNGFLYASYSRAQQREQAARSAGSGGGASFGGGGGFSGGGGGGIR